MKKNSNGGIEFKTNGLKENCYPHGEPIVFWDCQVGRVYTDNGTSIIAYKFHRNPHRAKDTIRGMIDLDPDNYSEEDAIHLFTRFDYNSNCFGYTFCGPNFWVDPVPDYANKNTDTIDLILKNDGYERIARPTANSIALFRDDIRYTHVCQTPDGERWISKPAIFKLQETTLESEMEKFGVPVFYKK